MATVRKLLGRTTRLDLQSVDVAVALVLVAAAVATVASSDHPSLAAGACAAIAAATAATRRRSPVASVAVAAVAISLFGLIEPSVDETAAGIGALLGFYTLGRTGTQRAAPVLDGGLLALGAVAVALGPQANAVDVVATWALFVGGPFAAGRVLESRRALTGELEAGAERARRAQEARAESAAAEERVRIARELHDVIAHGVSVMVIQAVAAREVAASDPDAARRSLVTVQASGREALLEIRRMVGVLRHGDVELAGAAAPGLGQLDVLAQRARAAGLPVELNVHGPRRSLPEGVDLVAFRVVQEALTNTIKHAGPARASVDVVYAARSLELEIRDDGTGGANGAADSGGHGLVGMRERLLLYGGELATGRLPGGGFHVSASIPVEAAA